METKLKDSEIVAELIESVRHDMEMPKEIWNRGMGLLQKYQQLNGTRKLHKSTSRRRAADGLRRKSLIPVQEIITFGNGN